MTASVTLVGRLVQTPVVEEVSSNGSVYQLCRFAVACQDEFSRDGVNFVDCTAWGTLAENLAQWKVKGDQVAVVGRLRQSKWVAEDGTNRSRLEVVANSIEFLATRRAEDQPPPTEIQVATAPPSAARPQPTLSAREEAAVAQQEQLAVPAA